MNKYQDDQDFKNMVESIIQDYVLKREQKNYFCIEAIEKETKKINLLNNILLQFGTMITLETKQLEINVTKLQIYLMKFEVELNKLQTQLDQIKAVMLKSVQKETGNLLYTPKSRSSCSIFEETNKNESYSQMKDVEENLKGKIKNLDNLVSLLMDNQVQIKSQLADLQKNGSQGYVPNSHQQQNDEFVQKSENRFNELKVMIEDVGHEQKQYLANKLMFFWKVLEEQSDKSEQLRKDLEKFNLFPNQQEKKTIQNLRRGSLMPPKMP